MTQHRGRDLLCGLVLGLVLAFNTASADDCREHLLGNSYACHFQFQVVTTTNGSDRIVIEAPRDIDIGFTDFTADDNPGNAFLASLSIVPGRTDPPLICSCKSKGNFANPDFGAASQAFFCTTGLRAEVGVMFEGQVHGDGGLSSRGNSGLPTPSLTLPRVTVSSVAASSHANAIRAAKRARAKLARAEPPAKGRADIAVDAMHQRGYILPMPASTAGCAEPDSAQHCEIAPTYAIARSSVTKVRRKADSYRPPTEPRGVSNPRTLASAHPRPGRREAKRYDLTDRRERGS